MNSILKTAAIAAFALALLSAPASLSANGHGKSIEQKLERMKKHLNLTDDQTSKIKAILESARQQAADGKSNRGDTEARREARQDLRESTQKQIMAVLTAEQQQLLAEKRRKRQN